MWIGPSSYFDLFPFIGGADLDLGLFLFGRFFGLSEPIAVIGAGLIVLGLWGFGLYCGLAFFFFLLVRIGFCNEAAAVVFIQSAPYMTGGL